MYSCVPPQAAQSIQTLNLLLMIMHPLSLLYFVHVAKLAFQFSVIFISLFNASSRVLADLPIVVAILSVIPLCHVLVPLWYPVELERLWLLGYFCIWYYSIAGK